MSKKDKLIEKIKNSKKDVSPDDVEKVLFWLGFEKAKPNGSSHQRYKRQSDSRTFILITNKNPVKKYIVDELIKIIDESPSEC